MFKGKISMSCVIAVAFVAPLSAPAFADAVVKVTLLDKGGEMDMSKNMGLGMGMKGDMKMSPMSIEINPKTVPVGKVTFRVTNKSNAVVHEMIVAAVKNENFVLPYKEAENRADEDKAGDLGEVSELDPGKSGSLIVEMKPGTYLLYCNVPGHYMMGMWTTLNVK